MILLDLGGEDHELYLKSEIDEIKNENLRRLYQEKFVIVENICQVLKMDLPRLALTSQINYGEVDGQALKHEDYENLLDRDSILVVVDYTTDAHVNLTIAHELRHLWQFKNEFAVERFIGVDDVNGWGLLSQEIDADAFAIAYYTCFYGGNVTKDAINKYVLNYSVKSEEYIRRVELSNKIIREIKKL